VLYRSLPLALLAALGCDTQSAPLRPIVGAGGTMPAADGRWSVQLVDEWGRALPSWQHTGATWIEGSYGARYNVLVTNHTPRRVEVVVSVDGRDVVSGRPGDFGAQRGYVVDAYGSVTIEGFRRSHNEVAAFRFTHPGDSYSARMGTPQNLGVVGVAVFTERPFVPPPVDLETKNAPATAQPRGEDVAGERQRLGTRYGETRHSAVVDVPFRRRAQSPDAVLALYYDDRKGLARRGVIQAPQPIHSAGPQPFPPSPGQCAPPPPP